jgi:hypothetical protein
MAAGGMDSRCLWEPPPPDANPDQTRSPSDYVSRITHHVSRIIPEPSKKSNASPLFSITSIYASSGIVSPMGLNWHTVQ